MLCSTDIRANRYATNATIVINGQVVTLYAIPWDYSKQNGIEFSLPDQALMSSGHYWWNIWHVGICIG